MAFIQQHRPQSGRQVSYHAPPPIAEATTASPQHHDSLEQSEEWVLFSPPAPSATTRTHTTSTERTPRTAGLSRFSEFGSLETAGQSDQDDDDDDDAVGTFLDTEEELDSLDDGLHAFHEPSEYGAPVGRLQESGDTVLPTHDGLGEFKPDATMQEHMWQFERSRRRAARRRSSVQRHLTILDDTDERNTEQERRQRIERWRLEQSKALLEEIEKETRRRRRMSMVSARSGRRASMQQPQLSSAVPQPAQSVSDAQSDSSEEGSENLSFWQRITRRVIRDLIGLDEDTLSVIFGESLPEEAETPTPGTPTESLADKALQDAGLETSRFSDDTWQTKLLERVAVELGTLVNQLSEHPGAFSTYQRTQSIPDYAGLTPVRSNTTLASDPASSRPASSQPTTLSASAQFAPTFPAEASHSYSEASLWGIEEEPTEADSLDSSHVTPAPTTNIAEDLAREREYWERDIDVKMIFNFLMKRFSSRRSSIPSLPQPVRSASTAALAPTAEEDHMSSARRAAIIRQHHPLVNRTTTDARLPTSSATQHTRESSSRRYATYYAPSGVQNKTKLRSSSSCASQSTKKSKKSGGSGRNYWDLGGSVGSGSVLAGEV
ncbi:hypothetical protein DDE82_004873 [Stemphylium lycopersici]|uniref:Uncharacterized protein n=1 Tax=Stemphylium lycopersici TaxID=183478 RepID=A0A364MU31_STELY|nr:hypothetical protein TW65_05002 [Stemphylium lycopersici]RAR03642.1 hypothetical protein DDE83_008158 [Stemphylium lycopersici]RAR03993.1 hypothetical protein DDE82_004873 [Stemphylium lycopersici]